MLFENTIFFVLKNKKQKIVFYLLNGFLVFLFLKIENCFRKQLLNRLQIIRFGKTLNLAFSLY